MGHLAFGNQSFELRGRTVLDFSSNGLISSLGWMTSPRSPGSDSVQWDISFWGAGGHLCQSHDVSDQPQSRPGP